MVEPSKALVISVVFLIAQQIEGTVIYPHVVGGSVGRPSYVTLAAVFVGGAVAGVPGMFFIIPIASVAYTLIGEMICRREADRKTAKEGEKQAVEG